ncbi:MAG: hypothetical protein LBP98_05515 [Tannerella sp.]|jgi:hypothetical protein|nr:hypothetical protein [Tannerella sp.]
MTFIAYLFAAQMYEFLPDAPQGAPRFSPDDLGDAEGKVEGRAVDIFEQV